jgi:hypothetical protein
MAGMARRGVNYWLIDIPTGRVVTTMEAEYVATVEAVKEAIWLKGLVSDLVL